MIETAHKLIFDIGEIRRILSYLVGTISTFLLHARYLSGDLKQAVSTLRHVLDNLDPTFAEAHLLMAQIQMQQGNFLNAQQVHMLGEKSAMLTATATTTKATATTPVENAA